MGRDTMHASVRYGHVDGPVYVDFPPHSNQSNLSVREIPPVMIQEWTTGRIEVEPGIEIETFLPRESVNDTCETHDACFCGHYRCPDADFKFYESYDCGVGMNLIEYYWYG